MSASQDALLGSAAVGQVMSTFLLGIFFQQCYTYFMIFRTDRLFTRIIVYFLLILNILHTGACELTLWNLNVTHIEQIGKWTPPNWLFASYPPFSGSAACVVELFYAHRIYLFNKRNWFVSVIVACGAILQLIWSIVATFEILRIKEIQKFRFWIHGIICWLGVAAVIDLVVTTSLVWSLLKARSAMQKTNNIIYKMIALLVGTNIVTFTVGLLDLFLLTFYNTPWHVATNICLVKIYSSSLLFWLNARPTLSDNFGGEKPIDIREMSVRNLDGRKRMERLEREGSAKDFGIQVVTTASLRADRLPPQAKSLVIPNPFGERLTHDQDTSKFWRGDSNNGFTIQIVGGRESNIPRFPESSRLQREKIQAGSGIENILGKL